MVNEIINKKSKNFNLSVRKPTAIAKERKPKVFNDLVCHKKSNIRVG